MEKDAESGMDTNEDTELDNTVSPNEPQISSADNVTDDVDSADDKIDNLDDRLASLAKASDLLHSIAEAAAAEESEHYSASLNFKEDKDDVLENEVIIFAYLHRIGLLVSIYIHFYIE